MICTYSADCSLAGRSFFIISAQRKNQIEHNRRLPLPGRVSPLPMPEVNLINFVRQQQTQPDHLCIALGLRFELLQHWFWFKPSEGQRPTTRSSDLARPPKQEVRASRLFFIGLLALQEPTAAAGVAVICD